MVTTVAYSPFSPLSRAVIPHMQRSLKFYRHPSRLQHAGYGYLQRVSRTECSPKFWQQGLSTLVTGQLSDKGLIIISSGAAYVTMSQFFCNLHPAVRPRPVDRQTLCRIHTINRMLHRKNGFEIRSQSTSSTICSSYRTCIWNRRMGFATKCLIFVLHDAC